MVKPQIAPTPQVLAWRAEAKAAAERAEAERLAAQEAAEARSYLFTFHPILKKTVWGGDGICPFKKISPAADETGESWEISHLADNVSVVANGRHAGKTLDDLIRRYGKRLTGKKSAKQYGDTFPLLVKFIDADDDLSIQVHPNDTLAKERHQSFGKTEMWYIIKATPGAAVYIGFAGDVNEEEWRKRVKNNTLTDILQRYPVSAGDVFFLPAGQVHAIGAGCFLAEIQQTSDITYRLYDYNRLDAKGEHRPLHLQEAAAAIDYAAPGNARIPYTPKKNTAQRLVKCPYFTTNLLNLDCPLTRDFARLDSFVLYLCIEGQALLQDNAGNETTLQRGQTLLVPAETESITLSPSAEGAKLLETYV